MSLEPFFEILSADLPEPKTELEYKNPYTLLVAVALSAQATDVGVNKATKELFRKVDTPEKMVKLGEAGLRDHIKTIGLYRNKAKNVIALSKILIEKHGSQVPHDRAALEALPGVGHLYFGVEHRGVNSLVSEVTRVIKVIKSGRCFQFSGNQK